MNYWFLNSVASFQPLVPRFLLPAPILRAAAVAGAP